MLKNLHLKKTLFFFILVGLTSTVLALDSGTSNTAEKPTEKKIFKTVTPSGNIIYSDRDLIATPTGKSHRLESIVYPPEVTQAKTPDTLANTKEGAKNKSAIGAVQEQPKNEKEKEEETLVKQREKSLLETKLSIAKSNCDNAKSNMNSMVGRVGRMNSSGQKEYLTDQQIAHEKSKLEELIVNNCY